MKNLLISTRLKLLIAVLALGTFAIGYNGLRGIRDSNESLKTVYEDRTITIAQLATVQKALLSSRLSLTQALAYTTPEQAQQTAADVQKNSGEVKTQWDAYYATKLTEQEAQLAKGFAAKLARYISEGQAVLLQALQEGKHDAASQINQDKLIPLFTALQADLNQLQTMQLSEAARVYEQSQARFTQARIFSWAIFLLSLGLAIGMGTMLIRGISASLKQAIAATHAVAQGDLARPITVDGKDEIAQLLQALQAMQLELTHVVSSVRQGSQAVAMASSEIAHGNNDLSARTEQQASALQQTAASMEQLSATVKQNAQASQQANQLAIAASGVAHSGGQAVGEVVETMQAIQASSQKIGAIIGVIDSIAFQTNILALNAAVEAARAGDQGRGFAVVATEVRALAGRSAAAAKEIRTLIQTSMEQVGHGSSLVNGAGQTMTEVAHSIQRVTDLMSEISAASNEQADGVAQIGDAVMQMDQVTQQNAALVEEMAAAASSLKNQANELVQSVAVFVLDVPVVARIT